MDNSEKLVEAIKHLADFQGVSLTGRIRQLEIDLAGLAGSSVSAFCSQMALPLVLSSALTVKGVAGQINVIVHAVGIILSLPVILQEGERIEHLSLGAGNAGKQFDLETNLQIAEFKFIDWQGGSETIRQNALFKAFYQLAEHPTPKKKVLYVTEDKHPLKFFQGRRATKSVFSRLPALYADMRERYGERFNYVCDYYGHRKADVIIVALNPLLKGIA